MTGRGLAHNPARPRLSFAGTDGMFQCRYLVATSHSKTRIRKNLRTFHPRQGPAGTPLSSLELLQTVQNCLQLQHPPKGCCSSWGLPEFTDGLSLFPGWLQLHTRSAPPWKAQQEGAARLLKLRDTEEFPRARQ